MKDALGLRPLEGRVCAAPNGLADGPTGNRQIGPHELWRPAQEKGTGMSDAMPPNGWPIQEVEYAVGSITGLVGLLGLVGGGLAGLRRRAAREGRREAEINARFEAIEESIDARFAELDQRETRVEIEVRELRGLVLRLSDDMKIVATKSDIAEFKADIKLSLISLGERIDKLFERIL